MLLIWQTSCHNILGWFFYFSLNIYHSFVFLKKLFVSEIHCRIIYFSNCYQNMIVTSQCGPIMPEHQIKCRVLSRLLSLFIKVSFDNESSFGSSPKHLSSLIILSAVTFWKSLSVLNLIYHKCSSNISYLILAIWIFLPWMVTSSTTIFCLLCWSFQIFVELWDHK